jgi:hypothetical protein
MLSRARDGETMFRNANEPLILFVLRRQHGCFHPKKEHKASRNAGLVIVVNGDSILPRPELLGFARLQPAEMPKDIVVGAVGDLVDLRIVESLAVAGEAQMQ